MGFSLAEVVATLTIGSLVLMVVLGIYSRASKSAEAITAKLKSSDVSTEILQRIAEDLDNLMATDSSKITINIQNKFDQGYPSARMIINKNFLNDKNNYQTLKNITWQSSYDFESSTPGLVIYRSHSGVGLEDKLLDKQKQDWERELFVPICEGVMFFKIQAIKENEIYDSWEIKELPHAVVVTISFVEPFETLEGTLDVFEEDKTTRTIVMDRTRRMGFNYIKNYNLDLDTPEDPNKVSENEQDANDVNDAL